MEIIKKRIQKRRKKKNTKQLKYITALENNIKYLERIDDLQRDMIALQEKYYLTKKELKELKGRLK